MEIIIDNEEEMRNFGKKIASETKERIILLEGDLGSGKTTFAKGFCEYFGIRDVTSPTFVIMKKYEIKNENFDYLYHIDCYRAETDLQEIGIKEILDNNNGIVIIEWPEKINQKIKGKRIKLEIIPEGRRVTVL